MANTADGERLYNDLAFAAPELWRFHIERRMAEVRGSLLTQQEAEDMGRLAAAQAITATLDALMAEVAGMKPRELEDYTVQPDYFAGVHELKQLVLAAIEKAQTCLTCAHPWSAHCYPDGCAWRYNSDARERCGCEGA